MSFLIFKQKGIALFKIIRIEKTLNGIPIVT